MKENEIKKEMNAVYGKKAYNANDHEKIFITESLRTLDAEALDLLSSYIELSNNLEIYVKRHKEEMRDGYKSDECVNYDSTFIEINPVCIPKINCQHDMNDCLVRICSRVLADGTPIPDGLDNVKELLKTTTSGLIVKM